MIERAVWPERGATGALLLCLSLCVAVPPGGWAQAQDLAFGFAGDGHSEIFPSDLVDTYATLTARVAIDARFPTVEDFVRWFEKQTRLALDPDDLKRNFWPKTHRFQGRYSPLEVLAGLSGLDSDGLWVDQDRIAFFPNFCENTFAERILVRLHLDGSEYPHLRRDERRWIRALCKARDFGCRRIESIPAAPTFWGVLDALRDAGEIRTEDVLVPAKARIGRDGLDMRPAEFMRPARDADDLLRMLLQPLGLGTFLNPWPVVVPASQVPSWRLEMAMREAELLRVLQGSVAWPHRALRLSEVAALVRSLGIPVYVDAELWKSPQEPAGAIPEGSVAQGLDLACQGAPWDWSYFDRAVYLHSRAPERSSGPMGWPQEVPWPQATRASPPQLEAAGTNEPDRPEFLHAASGLRFVEIPAGSFSMSAEPGSDEDAHPDEVAHRVKISRPFLISKYEVTNRQYRAWHSALRASESADENPDEPALVTFDVADAFCRAQGLRLPTEAEWEWVAQCGERGWTYPWGNEWPPSAGSGNLLDSTARDADPDAAASYRLHEKIDPRSTLPAELTDGFAILAPVGRFRPNDFGVHDLAGNAAEWCADRYEAFRSLPEVLVDPHGPATGDLRIVRGGTWRSMLRSRLRSAARNLAPQAGEPGMARGAGFRPVADVPPR